MTRRSATVTQRTTAVVLAGGKGTRLDPLTRTICKPALPFGGSFRCIDFSLSNCVNSGLRNIGVATQHEPDALLAHLWSHWNRPAVGSDTIIHAWRAEERAARLGYRGTADAVYRNLASIRDLENSLVLVLAGDHVYKMDYRPILEAHCARNAAVTIGCIEAPLEDACQFGVLAVADNGRIERFVEKPSSCKGLPRPAADTVLASMGIYVFDGAFLARVLESDAAQPDSGHDFGTDLLPRLIEGGRAYSYAFRDPGGAPAYWRDIGTLRGYWRAHMELLPPSPLLALADPTWPIGRVATAPLISNITTTAAGGTVESSIVTPSTKIAGHAQRSVLFDAVEIGRGAKVAEAVVLPGAVIGSGCRLRGVIVDAGYRVADGTVVEPLGSAGAPPVLSRYCAAETAGYSRLR
jgi:glucose-1-phosphate adenylyltransferase